MLNREALRAEAKELIRRIATTNALLSWDVEGFFGRIEAALSQPVPEPGPAPQPWQPKAGDTVEVVATGECGKVTPDKHEHGFVVMLAIRQREEVYAIHEIRPASIKPGDWVRANGKTGIVSHAVMSARGRRVGIYVGHRCGDRGQGFKRFYRALKRAWRVKA